MNQYPKFYVKKRTLLAIAGIVWMIAGFNVTRMGIKAYALINGSIVHFLLSFVVFCLFGMMFYRMSIKHSKRIQSYGAKVGFWHFFDLKAYLIMVFMMSMGIWLRSSGIVSTQFIAVFYTGLGIALFFAGVIFWFLYFKYSDSSAA